MTHFFFVGKNKERACDSHSEWLSFRQFPEEFLFFGTPENKKVTGERATALPGRRTALRGILD